MQELTAPQRVCVEKMNKSDVSSPAWVHGPQKDSHVCFPS